MGDCPAELPEGADILLERDDDKEAIDRCEGALCSPKGALGGGIPCAPCGNGYCPFCIC